MKKKKSKLNLSEYSQMLNLDIDEYTGLLRDDVNSALDAMDALECNDKMSVVIALSRYQSTVSHLVTEYRRVKFRWHCSIQEFEKLEMQAFIFARSELPMKSTEKQIKTLAYETSGDDLYKHKSLMDDLEQKAKVINDHIGVAKVTMSTLQTAANIMKLEWEASKL